MSIHVETIRMMISGEAFSPQGTEIESSPYHGNSFMKRINILDILVFLAFVASCFAASGCHKADQPERPKHSYLVGAVVTKKYVVEGNYEVIL